MKTIVELYDKMVELKAAGKQHGVYATSMWSTPDEFELVIYDDKIRVRLWEWTVYRFIKDGEVNPEIDEAFAPAFAWMEERDQMKGIAQRNLVAELEKRLQEERSKLKEMDG